MTESEREVDHQKALNGELRVENEKAKKTFRALLIEKDEEIKSLKGSEKEKAEEVEDEEVKSEAEEDKMLESLSDRATVDYL